MPGLLDDERRLQNPLPLSKRLRKRLGRLENRLKTGRNARFEP